MTLKARCDMKKYRYRWLHHPTESELNEWGEKGWRVVVSYGGGFGIKLLMEKQEDVKT